MSNYARIIFILLILFPLSCHNKGKQKPSEDAAVKRELAITQLLGSGYKTIPNTSDSLLLCLSKKDNNSERMHSVHAVVWDKIAEKIIFQKKFPGGKVSWYDAGHIKVVQMPGIVRDNEGAKSVIINIRTGEKQRLGDQLK